jgi:hypothetical protein
MHGSIVSSAYFLVSKTIDQLWDHFFFTGDAQVFRIASIDFIRDVYANKKSFIILNVSNKLCFICCKD